MTSLAPPVRVPDADAGVLFLVAQYLRDLGLAASVVALLRESGLDDAWLCGPSREVALLREWVLTGQWARVRAFLQPLAAPTTAALPAAGVARALGVVDKQARLEAFFQADTTPSRRRELWAELQEDGATKLIAQEAQQCMRLMACGNVVQSSAWRVDEARLQCFTLLVPLLRDEIGEDDDEAKFVGMPRRQLVALLNDALLFHHERQSTRTGNATGTSNASLVDYVTVVPVSHDAAMPVGRAINSGTVNDGGDDESTSALRLMVVDEEEHSDAVRRHDARSELSRSVDWSMKTRNTGGSSTDQARRPSDKRRNRLVMSMEFTTAARSSRRRKQSSMALGGVDERSESDTEDEVDEAQAVNREQSPGRQTKEIREEETQTELQDEPLPVTQAKAVETTTSSTQTDGVPVAKEAAEHNTTAALSANVDTRSREVVVDPSGSAIGNQSEALPAGESKLSRVVTPDADNELVHWCKTRSEHGAALDPRDTARRGSSGSRRGSGWESQVHAGASSAPLTKSRRHSHAEPHEIDQDDDAPEQAAADFAEQLSEREEGNLVADAMQYSVHDNDHDSDAHEDELESLPVSSYARLTLDAVVRARVVAEAREAQAVRAMDIAPDGSEVVIGTNARALRVFELGETLATAALRARSASSNTNSSSSSARSLLPLLPVTMEKHKHHASAIYCAAYNHVDAPPAKPLIATGAADTSIKVLSRWTQEEHWIRGHAGKTRALQFASATSLCSAASGDFVVRCWDLMAAPTAPCAQHFDGHVGEIQALALHPEERRSLVSASMDRTVRLWDFRSGQCARVLARTSSAAFALSFRPGDGGANGSMLLATGHQDGSVALWDVRATKHRALATLTHHQDECRAVSWSPDGAWLLSASFDGSLWLLDASGSRRSTSKSSAVAETALVPVASFRQHNDKLLQAQWHPTQPAIVTTGADKLIKLWAFA